MIKNFYCDSDPVVLTLSLELEIYHVCLCPEALFI